jgi:hypothetical protein
LIVVKYPRQAELFDDAPKYHVIASNRVESAADTLIWYRQRGEVSENGIKELKIGFGMERMPCGQFAANAAFFRIGVIAHRIHLSVNIVLAHRRGAGGFECRCDGKQTIQCSPLSDLGSQELHEIFHLGHLLRRDCSDLRHQALFNCSIHHHPPRLRRAQHAAAACIVFPFNPLRPRCAIWCILLTQFKKCKASRSASFRVRSQRVPTLREKDFHGIQPSLQASMMPAKPQTGTRSAMNASCPNRALWLPRAGCRSKQEPLLQSSESGCCSPSFRRPTSSGATPRIWRARRTTVVPIVGQMLPEPDRSCAAPANAGSAPGKRSLAGGQERRCDAGHLIAGTPARLEI